MPRSVEDALESVADVMFPAELVAPPFGIDTRTPEGDTPLHILAWRRDAEGARVILAAGADPNAVGDMGQTPLHVAIRQGDAEFVRLLLDARASVSAVSEFGRTPLEEAEAVGGVIADIVRDAGGA